MNANQYTEYQRNVETFLREHDIKPGCFSPADDNGESFFSWRPCRCCQSGLGGSREIYRFALNGNGGLISAAICTDCVYYLTYGKLDDLTMMEIEANA